MCDALNIRPRSKRELINIIEDKIEDVVCGSTVEKDLFWLRMDFDAPISFNYSIRMYEIEPGYDFAKAVIQYLKI